MARSAAFGDPSRSRFQLSFVDDRGGECRDDLAGCWGAAFEDVEPVRSFPSFKGQRNFPGWWWSSTSGRHVGHESWLERDHAMLLDFDPDVTGFASQPFRLHWLDEERARTHVPDFFARLADGTGVVIDVRADDRIEPVDAAAFAATELACDEVGWSFRRVGVIDPVFVANVRWLSRYRHPRCSHRGDITNRLLEVFTTRMPLFDGARAVGDTLAVLPALFHLLWCQVLAADLETVPLGPSSQVALGRLR